MKGIKQKMMDAQLPNGQAFFLVHLSLFPHKQFCGSVIRHLVTAAKSCIPLLWKMAQVPSLTIWLLRIEGIRKMEDLVLLTQNRHDSYRDTRYHWMEFLFLDQGRVMAGAEP